MNAIKFVEELKSIPNKDRVRKLGLGEDFISQYYSSFICLEKVSKPLVTGNVLLDLIGNYDCNNLQIGMLSFNLKTIEDDSYFYIGKMEVDDLVINKKNSQVEVIEFGVRNVLWECALNSASFLEALILCAKYLNDRVFEPDGDSNVNAIKKATDIAGGNDYNNFYTTLFTEG